MAQELNDALVVRIEASLRKFERQMEKARKAAVNGAQGAENAWRRGGKKIAANANQAATGLQRLTTISGRGRFVLQNTANQIGDIAVQMGSGTSATRALGQQLPQLLGGFGALGGALGLVGPLLGTVAALGLPVAAAFLSMGEGAATAEDQMSQMQEIVKSLDDSLELLALTKDQLIEKFGFQAEIVRGLIVALAELRVEKARDAMVEYGDLAQGATEEFSRLARLTQELTGRLDEMNTGGRNYALRELGRLAQELSEEFGVAEEEALRLSEAFDGLYDATTAQAQFAALSRLRETMQDLGIETSEVPRELRDAIEKMAEFGILVAEAETKMNNLAAATANVNVGVPLFQRGLSPQDLLPPVARPSLRSSSRRSGGRSARVPEGLREAEKIFERTRTEAERYQVELQRINELHRLFPQILTEEVRNRAIAALDEGVNKLDQSAQSLERSLSNTFASIISGSASAKDALSGLLSQFAQLLAQSAFTGLFGGSGGLLSGLGIPGFATGTSFAPGGMALVGERGPELVNLPRGSQVINANRTEQMLSAGGVVNNWNIDARGAQAGVGEEIRRALEGYGPTIDRRAVAAVSNARRRGAAV